MEKAQETQLKQLEGELIIMKESMRETAMDIIKEGFSEYPVFIAHQSEIKLGELILDKRDMATNWSISASTLEDFVERGLIQPDRVDAFKTAYQDPKTFICLFVIYDTAASFVFVPYRKSPGSPAESV